MCRMWSHAPGRPCLEIDIVPISEIEILVSECAVLRLARCKDCILTHCTQCSHSHDSPLIGLMSDWPNVSWVSVTV